MTEVTKQVPLQLLQEWHKAFREITETAEVEIAARHGFVPGEQMPPALERRFRRDMEEVAEAKVAMEQLRRVLANEALE